jgi:hypothetical protein
MLWNDLALSSHFSFGLTAQDQDINQCLCLQPATSDKTHDIDAPHQPDQQAGEF